MKVITVKQPWAYMICTPRQDNPYIGIKDIENRTWPTKFRGKVLIHAGLSPQKGFYKDFVPTWHSFTEDQKRIIIQGSGIRGAIIGSVEIVDCVINYPSIWAETSEFSPYTVKGLKPIYNWVLANPILFEKPILNVKGKLSFWEPEEWVKNELNKML